MQYDKRGGQKISSLKCKHFTERYTKNRNNR